VSAAAARASERHGVCVAHEVFDCRACGTSRVRPAVALELPSSAVETLRTAGRGAAERERRRIEAQRILEGRA